jgi:class 3 adenylate cyclase
MAGHPPSGTVTFLLTDLEGSTRLWEQDPEAMKAAMVRHDELLEKTIAAHDGFVFARMGDGMAAAFATASDAVSAAAAIQRSLAGEPWCTASPLPLHRGTPLQRGVPGGRAGLRGRDHPRLHGRRLRFGVCADRRPWGDLGDAAHHPALGQAVQLFRDPLGHLVNVFSRDIVQPSAT